MTPPADLAALRALMEAGEFENHDHIAVLGGQVPCRVCDLLPAAREALGRVAANSWLAYREDIATVKQEHWLRVQALQARIAGLEGALLELLREYRDAPYDTVKRARAALEGC